MQSSRAVVLVCGIPAAAASGSRGRRFIQSLKRQRKGKTSVLSVSCVKLGVSKFGKAPASSWRLLDSGLCLGRRLAHLVGDKGLQLVVIAEDPASAWSVITFTDERLQHDHGIHISEVVQRVDPAIARYVSLYSPGNLRAMLQCEESVGAVVYPRVRARSCAYTKSLADVVQDVFAKHGVLPDRLKIAKRLVWEFLSGTIGFCGCAALVVGDLLANANVRRVSSRYAIFLSFQWPHQKRSPLQMVEHTCGVGCWVDEEEPVRVQGRVAVAGCSQAVAGALQRIRLITESAYPNCLVIKEAETGSHCYANEDIDCVQDQTTSWDLSFRTIFREPDEDDEDFEYYLRCHEQPGCQEMSRLAAKLGCLIGGFDDCWHTPPLMDDETLSCWDVTSLTRCYDYPVLQNRSQLKSMACPHGLIVVYQTMDEGCSWFAAIGGAGAVTHFLQSVKADLQLRRERDLSARLQEDIRTQNRVLAEMKAENVVLRQGLVDTCPGMLSTMGRRFIRYQLPAPRQGCWWHTNTGNQQCEWFEEGSPGNWKQFIDPADSRCYWWNCATGEFFYATD